MKSCVYIVNLCHERVANYSRTSLQLSHSSEIGALAAFSFSNMKIHVTDLPGVYCHDLN